MLRAMLIFTELHDTTQIRKMSVSSIHSPSVDPFPMPDLSAPIDAR